MIFKQIKFDGDNFSYIIADENTKEAAVVDPSYNAKAIIDFVSNKGINVKYIFFTHHHIDHTADGLKLKKTLGSLRVAHQLSEVEKDLSVKDGDIINLGDLKIKVIHTPGHTSDGICLLVDHLVMTGDTLFVGESGRTDLPDSDIKNMYNSLFGKLLMLDDGIEVYPGHDYGPKQHSTIGEEKRTNYVLKKRTLNEFIEFMHQP